MKPKSALRLHIAKAWIYGRLDWISFCIARLESLRLLLNFGIFIPLQAREFCLHWSICRVFACFGLTEFVAYQSFILRQNPSHRQRVACLTKSSTKCWLISSSQRPFHYPSTKNSILFVYHVGLDA